MMCLDNLTPDKGGILARCLPKRAQDPPPKVKAQLQAQSQGRHPFRISYKGQDLSRETSMLTEICNTTQLNQFKHLDLLPKMTRSNVLWTLH